MVTPKLLVVLNEKLQQMRKNNLPFRGVVVLLFGDFLQLKPTVGESLIDASLILNSLAGELFRKFNRTKLIMQQRSQEDSIHSAIIKKIRDVTNVFCPITKELLLSSCVHCK